MRKRILFIAPSAYVIGGVQTWLDYLLPGLRSHGWDVILGLASGRLHDVRAYVSAHPFAHIRPIHAPTGTREGRKRGLMQAIGDVRPDLVVVVNLADAYAAAASLRSERTVAHRIVATLHGLQPDFLQDFKRHSGHLDAVICTNHLARDLVAEFCGIGHDRIFRAPYGVAVPDLPPCDTGQRSSTLRLAYVGRLEAHQKRVRDVAEIFRRALASGLDATLRIAGDGPEAECLKGLVESLGVGERVVWLGPLAQAKVRDEVYRKCDVLLLTSSWETGPIVAWEAMAAGLALVTSDFLGRRREGRLADGVNCRVFPVGDAEVAVSCLHALQDPDTMRAIARAGRTMVMEAYSHECSVGAWATCFEQILGLPPRPYEAIARTGPPQGRLDRVFGTNAAETLRRLLRRRYHHRDPGGEWPHSYGDRQPDDPEFWRKAQLLDTPRGGREMRVATKG